MRRRAPLGKVLPYHGSITAECDHRLPALVIRVLHAFEHGDSRYILRRKLLLLDRPKLRRVYRKIGAGATQKRCRPHSRRVQGGAPIRRRGSNLEARRGQVDPCKVETERWIIPRYVGELDTRGVRPPVNDLVSPGRGGCGVNKPIVEGAGGHEERCEKERGENLEARRHHTFQMSDR